MPQAPRQCIVVLDVEGVLTPEIWIAVAEQFELPALRRTTKDEPDYGALMRGRLALLSEHDISLTDIQNVIAKLSPLPGAKDFLDELRADIQVLLLSDTFEQFIGPLMAQLGYPTILCHSLDTEAGRILGFEPRLLSQKRRAVEALRDMNYYVIAAGDSFNDLEMIDAAHTGLLFRSPATIQAQRPDLAAFESYENFASAIRGASSRLLSR